ncbi:alpha/beta fold hydrolase [Streptacidiphilus sp. 4-A2]|nr:alpha/beta fold hydrolase [Streptacidiphilus sp. 4-A2]
MFVHGIKSSAATWDAVRESLAQTEDLADLEPQPPFEYATGVFGNKPVRMKKPLSLSDALRVLPSLDTIADSLVSYLDTEAAEFERLVLVGHSMGGLVIQRFLTRMLARGRGTDLARIRRVVLLACPNQGSDLALVLRKRYRLRNPQEKALRPFDEPVTDTRALVLAQIVNAPPSRRTAAPSPSPSMQAPMTGWYPPLPPGVVSPTQPPYQAITSPSSTISERSTPSNGICARPPKASHPRPRTPAPPRT